MNTPRMTAPGHADQADRHHLRWETALDRLELDVVRAERMVEDPSRPAPSSWDEPQLSGPIPDDLVDRALHLRERQRRAQAALTATLGDVARQHGFASRVDRATRLPDRPVYVDVTA
jgi:hypothetical protein